MCVHMIKCIQLKSEHYFHLRKLNKEEQIKCTASRGGEMTNITTEINKQKNNKENNKSKIWLLKNIQGIYQHLARLGKKNLKKTNTPISGRREKA